jgi:hypothetical protein
MNHIAGLTCVVSHGVMLLEEPLKYLYVGSKRYIYVDMVFRFKLTLTPLLNNSMKDHNQQIWDHVLLGFNLVIC